MNKITKKEYEEMTMAQIQEIVNRGGDEKLRLNEAVSDYLDGLKLSDKAREQINQTDYSILSDVFGGCFTSEEVEEVVNWNSYCEEEQRKELKSVNSKDAKESEVSPKEYEKIEEVTMKFGKGLVGEPFQGKDGNEYREIKIPNKDENDKSPWASFVVKSNQIHDDKFGKGMFMKLPADGSTTVRKDAPVGEKDGKMQYETNTTKVPNTELKGMVEFYKDRDQSKEIPSQEEKAPAKEEKAAPSKKAPKKEQSSLLDRISKKKEQAKEKQQEKPKKEHNKNKDTSL